LRAAAQVSFSQLLSFDLSYFIFSILYCFYRRKVRESENLFCRLCPINRWLLLVVRLLTIVHIARIGKDLDRNLNDDRNQTVGVLNDGGIPRQGLVQFRFLQTLGPAFEVPDFFSPPFQRFSAQSSFSHERLLVGSLGFWAAIWALSCCCIC